jgi:dihydrolipoamide dehydrogenase
MLAIGRRPRLERLDLDAAGVEHTATGIVADGWGRTNVDRIWAIGDVTGNTLTTHGANAVGRRVVRAIALPKLPRIGRAPAIPNAIYSRPAVASVGMSTERLAARSPTGRRRYTIDLSTLDRGHTDAIEHGIVVVDVERFTGKVLRAAIVGPAASEWIGIFTIAIDHGIGLRKLFGMVHPYPAHAQAIGRITDDFARDTFAALPREWCAMVRGRLADRLRR